MTALRASWAHWAHYLEAVALGDHAWAADALAAYLDAQAEALEDAAVAWWPSTRGAA